MTRAGIAVVAVLVIALIGGIAYYRSSMPGDARAECIARFDGLDSPGNDKQLEYNEFLAYQGGLTSNDFSKADTDSNQVLTVQEFCAWQGGERAKG